MPFHVVLPLFDWLCTCTNHQSKHYDVNQVTVIAMTMRMRGTVAQDSDAVRTNGLQCKKRKRRPENCITLTCLINTLHHHEGLSLVIKIPDIKQSNVSLDGSPVHLEALNI